MSFDIQIYKYFITHTLLCSPFDNVLQWNPYHNQGTIRAGIFVYNYVMFTSLLDMVISHHIMHPIIFPAGCTELRKDGRRVIQYPPIQLCCDGGQKYFLDLYLECAMLCTLTMQVDDFALRVYKDI